MPRITSKGWTFIAVALLTGAVWLGYRGSLEGEFVFDDHYSIIENPSIRQLWPLTTPLSPPAEGTTGGRPVANLTFALNHAWGEHAVGPYHWTNLLIHLLTGLALFGLVRRAGALVAPSAWAAHRRDVVALLVALLWLLQPVQSGTVNYISQRTEQLMALFYLLTLYCFVRRVSGGSVGWSVLAVVCCALGMGSKEVMVTAPVLILLFDRTFIAGSFRAALRARGRLYAALGATWLGLAWLMNSAPLSRRGVGFDAGIDHLTYLATEARVLIRYLGLAVWPEPLVFDYGWDFIPSLAAAVPYFIACLGLLLATGWALRMRNACGFFGACFFIVLAPTSSLVPIHHQPMAESRLYLPLVAVVAGGVIAVHRLAGTRGLVAVTALALAFGVQVAQRHEAFRTAVSLWTDTVAKRPDNARAHANLGSALLAAQRPEDARQRFTRALELRPRYPEAEDGLGVALLTLNQPEAALDHFANAVRLWPDFAGAESNWGNALLKLDRPIEALPHYERARQLNPGLFEAQMNLAQALVRAGRPQEALTHLTPLKKLHPAAPAVLKGLGDALADLGQLPAAIEYYRSAIQYLPNFVQARRALATALAALGRHEDAVREYQAALRIEPDSFIAHHRLSRSLLALARATEAIEQATIAVRLRPGSAEAHHDLANAFVTADMASEAMREYAQALRLQPNLVEAHNNLGVLLLRSNKPAEAREHFATALRLRPDHADARDNLRDAIKAMAPAGAAAK